jgi:protein MAK11
MVFVWFFFLSTGSLSLYPFSTTLLLTPAMDKTKKPLKSALKKTSKAPPSTAPLKSALKKTSGTTAAVAMPVKESAKRKHTPATPATKSQNNKRAKTEQSDSHTKGSAVGSKPSGAANKNRVVHATQTKKNNTAIHKPKKVPVIPEGATLEDFRIVAGTYENILYGVDAYWNEVSGTSLSHTHTPTCFQDPLQCCSFAPR